MQGTNKLFNPTLKIRFIENLEVLTSDFIILQSPSAKAFQGGLPVRGPFCSLQKNQVTWVGLRPILSDCLTTDLKGIKLPHMRWETAPYTEIKPTNTRPGLYLGPLDPPFYPFQHIDKLFLKL